jgi:hypothetical protein
LSLNELLDRLPRTRVGRARREAPAFRTCGIVGFYLAIVATLAGTLLAGLTLLVAAALCAVCGLSFFAYAHLRRWLTGEEELVLLEHVWFAELCAAGFLWAFGLPVLAYLDVVAVGLCFFLACGRVGCLLVGCCRGAPSAVGIRYGEDCAREGFPRHLVGVRLLPVPAFEAAGLVLIGVTGLIALPFAHPGDVFAWFLLGYAVMRFGLEGLRTDERPELLGLSQSRWMCLGELTLVLALGLHAGGDLGTARTAALFGLLGALLVAGLILWRALDPRRALLAPAHLEEVRALAAGTGASSVALHTSSRGVSVGTSRSEAGFHLSLSLPGELHDLPLLCDLAAHTLAEARPVEAEESAEGVLHIHARPAATTADTEHARSLDLYGHVVRRLQAGPPAAGDERSHNYFGHAGKVSARR